MDELDAMLESQPVEAPTLAGADGKPACKHPRHKRFTDSFGRWCQCGHEFDAEKVRRGRLASRRGKRIQAQRITGLGGRNLPGNAPNLDGLGAMFAYESKSGGAFSDRYWRWLTGIPKRGNETGVLIVTEAPGPGRKARSYVVVEYDQWRELHGE